MQTHSEGGQVFPEQLVYHILRQQRLQQLGVTLWGQIWMAHHLHTTKKNHTKKH